MTRILVDYDGEIPDDMEKRSVMVVHVLNLTLLSLRIDKTRHGWHLILVVRERITLARVIAIQAILGSDWKRELFNLQRERHRGVPKFWKSRRNVLYHIHHRSVKV